MSWSDPTLVLGYDPVAGTLTVDPGGGGFPFDVPVGRVVVKFYGEVILYADLGPAGAAVGFEPVPAEPAAVALVPVDARRWRVVAVPAG